MTEVYDDKTRNALVDYRLERAHLTFTEVEKLLELGFYSNAINRLYYAVYYAAMALLIKDGFSPATHAGVKTMLNLHYIKPGKMSKESGASFRILFEKRQSCDYDDFIEISQEEVAALIPDAKAFIDEVASIISPSGAGG